MLDLMMVAQSFDSRIAVRVCGALPLFVPLPPESLQSTKDLAPSMSG